MDIPAFHPEWLITFWLSTPGLNKMDPHLVLFLAVVAIILIFFVKRKKQTAIKPQLDEERFQNLLKSKNNIEKELEEIVRSGVQDEARKQELEKRLALTKYELQQFTQ